MSGFGPALVMLDVGLRIRTLGLRFRILAVLLFTLFLDILNVRVVGRLLLEFWIWDDVLECR